VPSGEVFADAVAAATARHLALAPAASMQQLAQAAGISRATLFRRFPSRAALVAELCEAAARAYVRAVDEAALEEGTPTQALARVVEALGRLASVVGLLGLQPLDEHVEASLLAQTAEAEDKLRRLVRRGQEGGLFRVEVDPEWFLAMLTWLMVATADSVRLGRLTANAAHRHLAATLATALLRPDAMHEFFLRTPLDLSVR
jgi:TetR/AcrR family transcriptional repressor of mexCD-oprJ operon